MDDVSNSYNEAMIAADESIREAKVKYDNTLNELYVLVAKQADGEGPEPRAFETQLNNKAEDLNHARRAVLGALQRRSTVECAPWRQ